jgi:hypothetical protein
MSKRLLLTFLIFCVVAALVIATGAAAAPSAVALPELITAETPCPVAGCAQTDGACHAAATPPVPDGTFEMLCPVREGCTDTQCHAWERIDSVRTKPLDASMNLWILMPVIFTVALVAIVRKMR